MKIFLLILFALLLPDSGGEKFLEEILLYQKDSYFKTKVYAEHDWKSFMQLKEANEILNPDNYDLHLLNAAVFFATNKLRDRKNQKQLQFSPGLRDAAVVHSYQMVAKKFFSHINNKTPKLRSPDDRIKMFANEFSSAGENIDYNHFSLTGQTTNMQAGEMIVDDFLHSPPHKKTMLSKSFNHLGCAAIFETKPKDGLLYFKATQDYSWSR